MNDRHDEVLVGAGDFAQMVDMMAGWPAWKLRRRFREIERANPPWHSPLWWERLAVLAAMSRVLPDKPISLAKVLRASGSHPFGVLLDEAMVAKYKAADDAPPPVVVIGVHGCGPYELCDGHHRVTAALRRGDTTIRAVFAAERMPAAKE